MAKYIAETPRIDVKFIDAKTEQTLFEVNDRNWMNVGELMTANYGNTLIQNELKGKKLPKKVLIITVKELILQE